MAGMYDLTGFLPMQSIGGVNAMGYGSSAPPAATGLQIGDVFATSGQVPRGPMPGSLDFNPTLGGVREQVGMAVPQPPASPGPLDYYESPLGQYTTVNSDAPSMWDQYGGAFGQVASALGDAYQAGSMGQQGLAMGQPSLSGYGGYALSLPFENAAFMDPMYFVRRQGGF